jgi:hypothetical protein
VFFDLFSQHMSFFPHLQFADERSPAGTTRPLHHRRFRH